MKALSVPIVIGHLCLVGYGASRMPGLDPSTLGGRAVLTYGNLSASNNFFAFFSPSIGPGVKIRYSLNGAGYNSDQCVFRLNGLESNQRLHTLAYMALKEDQETRRRIAVSWAAYLLKLHPKATGIVIHIDCHNMPTLADFRLGERGGWTESYTVEFVR